MSDKDALKWESLHAHTDRSDGNQSHNELLRTAEELGYSTIAFTDHDILPEPATIKQLRDYDGLMRWVSGIEITSGLPKEMESDASLHILGLFIDPTNQDFIDYSQEMQASRLRRLDHYIDHFNTIGLKVTKEEVLNFADGSPVGSPHMVQAIYAHPENLASIERMLEEFKEATQKDEKLQKQYDDMEAKGENQIPYQLFMTKRSFKPVPEGDYRREMLDFDKTVSLIHEAGGVAILAHWFYEKEDLPADKLEELIKDERIDGVETDSENAITKHTHSEEVAFLEGLVEKYDCLQTVGADSHSKDDLKVFTQSQAAKKSIGHTDKLINQADVNTRWSNING